MFRAAEPSVPRAQKINHEADDERWSLPLHDRSPLHAAGDQEDYASEHRSANKDNQTGLIQTAETHAGSRADV